MIPRLSERATRKDGRGQSFRDLSAYLFNGPLDGPNPARAPWAEAINCHCSDPSQAWHEMAFTATHADALKQAAGARRGGQKNEFPVWHLSLNWRDDEKPTRTEMMDAARSVLKKFGLQDHQALVVFHDDTKHPHVHLMVNTVNPHTGRTVDVSRSTMYRLSAWAREYERERGQILCPQREENWKARADNKTMRRVWESIAQKNPALGPAKQTKTYGKSDSRPIWQLKQQAKDLGMSPENLVLFGQHISNIWRGHYEKERAGEPIVPRPVDAHTILNRITRGQSTFTRADLARAVSAVTKNADDFTTMFHKVLALPEVKDLQVDTAQARYSTETIIRTETEMAQAADNRAASYKHKLTGAKTVDDVKGELSAQQLTALQHVTDAGGIACVVGYAGTGKSTMLSAARELWEASGYNVRGCAFTGKAAESLQAGSGIRSNTLHRLLNQIGKGKLTSRDVLVLDEAGMVGSRQMHALLTAADKAGAKVVLVGDPQQLQAIEAGAAFRSIIDRVGTATITQVRRQRAEWQQNATVQLATGQTKEALDAYAQAGCVHARDTKDEARQAMVAEWAALLGDGKSNIMLAGTKKDVAGLNFAARNAMRAADLLFGQDRRITAREEVMDEPAHDFHMQVATGDRLLFTKNDDALGVKRGSLGTFEGFKGNNLIIRLDGNEQRRVEVDLLNYRNLAHGYALTIHKAQGVTVDRAHVLAGRSMDSNSSYVALSRHRDSVSLHYSRTDARDLAALSRQLGRERPKDTTLDYAKPYRAPYQIREQRQERALLAGSLSKVVGGQQAARAAVHFDNASQYTMKGAPSRGGGRER